MYEYRKLTPQQKRELVQERLARGFPPHSPPHFQQDQATYLLTAACYEHAPHMRDKSRRASLLDRLFSETISAGVQIHAWVILPNHYHILATVDHFSSISSIFRRLHGATSHAWNGEDNARGRKVWYRFADRMIRNESHHLMTLNYIHYNPVKHGWASSPYEWDDSSVHWYLTEHGRDWLRSMWVRYPFTTYGDGWDS